MKKICGEIYKTSSSLLRNRNRKDQYKYDQIFSEYDIINVMFLSVWVFREIRSDDSWKPLEPLDSTWGWLANVALIKPFIWDFDDRYFVSLPYLLGGRLCFNLKQSSTGHSCCLLVLSSFSYSLYILSYPNSDTVRLKTRRRGEEGGGGRGRGGIGGKGRRGGGAGTSLVNRQTYFT